MNILKTIKFLDWLKQKLSIKFNKCDLITFFDDDIILEPDYLLNIIDCFRNNPNIYAANGTIINKTYQNSLRRFFFRYTHIGLFKDNRDIGSNFNVELDETPRRINKISGGLSSWRQEIFEIVKFDTKNFFHCMEDIEFSIRFNMIFKNTSYIIPNARLFHHHLNNGLLSENKQIFHSVKESIMLFKKYKRLSIIGIDLFLILIYYFIYSIYLGLKYKSLKLILSYFHGIIEGKKEKIIT